MSCTVKVHPPQGHTQVWPCSVRRQMVHALAWTNRSIALHRLFYFRLLPGAVPKVEPLVDLDLTDTEASSKQASN